MTQKADKEKWQRKVKGRDARVRRQSKIAEKDD